MKRKEFFATSFVLAVKYFLGLGPLIGGFYLLAKTGFVQDLHSGYAILFLILYFVSSYVSGIVPALMAATVWLAILWVISFVHMNSVLKMPLIFLVGSSAISGLAGYGVELLWERHLILHAGVTYSDAAAIAGFIVGFMAANGVLIFAENKDFQYSKG